MKQLQGWSMVLALSVAGAVLASTSPTEGTAADSTPPGERATGDAARIAATGDAKMSAHRASKIIGMKVQTPAGESVGEVKDIVIDDNGRISQLIVDRASKSGARSGLVSVPWSTASSMIKGGTLVMEQARLDDLTDQRE